MATNLPRLVAVLCLFFPAWLPIAAAEADLKRTAPVPENQPIPVIDFFRSPLIRAPQLNLAGTHLAAYYIDDEDKSKILVTDLKAKAARALGGSGDRDIYYFQWLDDKRLIYQRSSEKRYAEGLYAVSVQDLDSAYPLNSFCVPMIVSVPPKNRMRPLVWLRQEYDGQGQFSDGGVVELRADMESNGSLDLDQLRNMMEINRNHISDRFDSPKGGRAVGYYPDKEGRLALGFTEKDGLNTLHHFAKNKWVKSPVDLLEMRVHGCGNNPKEIIVSSHKEPGTPDVLAVMDVATGRMGEILFHDPAYNFHGSLYRDPVSNDVVGASFDREAPTSIWFDPGYRKLQESLNQLFPGLVVRIKGSDMKGSLFVVETFSDRQPASFYLVDMAAGGFSLIGESRPWINPKRMRPMGIIKFKTRDGCTLDGYLTLPEGASKTTPAPLVVLCHGGPYARDSWVFDPEVQFLASRGYAVLQPNYRGSKGYTWQFPDEDRWAYRKMHDDVTDVVQKVLKSGLVDPSRVAIMGASFGGYLAVSGVAHEPSLYRCAVTNVGVFNFEQMIKDSKYDRFDNGRYKVLMRQLGNPKKFKDKFTEMSPINYVDQIRVPVFVAHGIEDKNVDVEQSRKLIAALKKNNIPCETMLTSGEGHGMQRLKNRVELHQKIEAFLAKNLAPLAVEAAVEKPVEKALP